MIIRCFKNVGKGPSKGPINYLLGKDKDGNERDPAPVILSGSKEAVAFLIDNNHRQHKYTSGVIAFRDDERPTAQQLNELLKDFRKTFLPGLDDDKCPVLIVRHLEKGSLEVHFLVAKQTSSGKALNIAPPGPQSQKLFSDFQKIQNEKMGFKQVTSNTKNVFNVKFDNFEKDTGKAKIGAYLYKKVKANELHTYSDLLRHLERDLKVKITRKGKDYISVKFPNETKTVRLRGPAFTPGADLREILKNSSSEIKEERLTPEKKEQIQKSLDDGIQKRREFNDKLYNSNKPTRSRALNFKSNSKLSKVSLAKTGTTAIKEVPKGVGQTPAQRPQPHIGEQVPVSQSLKTAIGELSVSTLPNTSTQEKKSTVARFGGSGSGGSGGGSSIDMQIASLRAKMNSERDPAKRAFLHSQLLALQSKKEEQARQQHNDQLKRINKIGG